MSYTPNEILSKFFGKEKLLRVSLSNGHIHSGSLVGFYHGDAEHKDANIEAWHLISEDQIADYKDCPEKYAALGIIVGHSEIRSIELKQ